MITFGRKSTSNNFWYSRMNTYRAIIFNKFNNTTFQTWFDVATFSSDREKIAG